MDPANANASSSSNSNNNSGSGTSAGGQQQQRQPQPSKRHPSSSSSVPDHLPTVAMLPQPQPQPQPPPPRSRSLGSFGGGGASSRKTGVAARLLPDFDRLAGVSAGLSWMLPPGVFTDRRRGKSDTKGMEKSVRKFYKQQDSLIDTYDRIYADIVLADGGGQPRERGDQADDGAATCSIRLAQLSFFVNLALVIIKAVAIGLSSSLSVISSLIDSLIDLISGVVVWIANRQVKSRNPYYYPQGKTRLEPISIVILAVIMSTSTLQIILKAFDTIATLATAESRRAAARRANATSVSPPCCSCNASENGTVIFLAGGSCDASDDVKTEFSVFVFVLVGAVIVIKLTLYLLCSRLGTTSSTEALAQDHRNDTVSNSTVLVMTLLSKYLWPYCDAIGALCISVYIIYTWVQTLKEQVRLLTGYTADPDFLKQLTYISLNHHELVRQIDTVRAFHIGNNFLVEVDIVLPEDMSLREAHDIGESLQCKLERLDEVERAFVHLDYESNHHPSTEHTHTHRPRFSCSH